MIDIDSRCYPIAGVYSFDSVKAFKINNQIID